VRNPALAEKFSTARGLLARSQPDGDVELIVAAFHECNIALMELDRATLGPEQRALVESMEITMDTGGLVDTLDEGLWIVKARQLSLDEILAFASSLDGMIAWMARSHRESAEG
jgi:hypothetical protein